MFLWISAMLAHADPCANQVVAGRVPWPLAPAPGAMNVSVKLRTTATNNEDGPKYRVAHIDVKATGALPDGALYGMSWPINAPLTLRVRGVHTDAVVPPPRPVWTLCERPEAVVDDQPIAEGRTWMIPKDGNLSAKLSVDGNDACRVRIGMVQGLQGPLSLKLKQKGPMPKDALMVSVPFGADQTSTLTWKWWIAPEGWIVIDLPGCPVESSKDPVTGS